MNFAKTFVFQWMQILFPWGLIGDSQKYAVDDWNNKKYSLCEML